jgi:hypothetical protein
MTPKRVAPHLLAVLGELTNFDEGVDVPMNETYAPVCERMGVAEDVLGRSSHGTFTTHRQIGLAMRTMRDKGLTRYEKRGRWGLTIEGVRQVRTKGTEAEGTEAEGTEAEGTEAEGTEAEGTEAEGTEAEGTEAEGTEAEGTEAEGTEAEVTRDSPPFVGGKHLYSDDPYIRGLAARQTPCFGFYVDTEPLCQKCPLAVDCMAGIGTCKAVIAAEITAKERDLAAKMAAMETQKQARDISIDDLLKNFSDDENQASSSTPKKSPSHASGKFRPAADQAIEVAEAQRETVCPQCGKKVSKGEECWWVRDEGMFHAGCVEIPQPSEKSNTP